MKKKQSAQQVLLEVEGLEERIAPGIVIDGGEEPPKGDEPPKPEDKVQGNNGWGNGEDAAPGNSLENQPKFEDPNTGESPSNSPASADGDR
jgi:hypothetical protein